MSFLLKKLNTWRKWNMNAGAPSCGAPVGAMRLEKRILSPAQILTL